MHLVRTDENTAEIESLTQRWDAAGGAKVGIDGVLADLDRRARRTFAPSPRLLGRAVDRALTWDGPDRRDPLWWPQGITQSLRTGLGRDVFAVSWYHKGDHGSRISVLDPKSRRYRHVLLVEPTADGFKPLRIHAGGIVWHGPHLHVAATGRGFLTCRFSDVLRVPDAALAQTFGHRYVLPVRFAYRAVTDKGVEKLRYSFLSLDRSGDAPTLVVGEYGSADQSRRIGRFPTDDTTGLLRSGEDGRSLPTIEDRGEVRMQGAAVADGTYYLTASQGKMTRGTVYVGTPGDFRELRHATPIGPEDIVWWPETERFWSVTEHPRRRWIFAMRKDRLDRMDRGQG